MFALAFALRGTLTQTERLERDAFVELVRERAQALGMQVREDEAAAAADALFIGADGEVVYPTPLADAVTRFVGDTVAAPVLIARFRQIASRLVRSHVALPPQTRETLERIASLGIPMAVLCNGWSRIAHGEAACAGFSGPVLASETIGVETPARRAFERLVDSLAVPADRVWYVGSDPYRDVDGAVRAGLTAVWLNRTGATYPAQLESPAFTVRSIDEILPAVCEEYTRSLLSLRHVMRTALEWRDGHYVPADQR